MASIANHNISPYCKGEPVLLCIAKMLTLHALVHVQLRTGTCACTVAYMYMYMYATVHVDVDVDVELRQMKSEIGTCL